MANLSNDALRLTTESLATDLLRQYPEDARWTNSPYRVFHLHKSKVTGTIAEKFTQKLLIALGLPVLPRMKGTKEVPASSHDFRIGEKKVELKMSSEWQSTEGSGMFRFQQIRDQEYDFCIFLGVTPATLYLWCMPKAVAWQNCAGQHGGNKAKETKLVDLHDFRNPPEWLRPYGGELTAECISTMKATLGIAEE